MTFKEIGTFLHTQVIALFVGICGPYTQSHIGLAIKYRYTMKTAYRCQVLCCTGDIHRRRRRRRFICTHTSFYEKYAFYDIATRIILHMVSRQLSERK